MAIARTAGALTPWRFLVIRSQVKRTRPPFDGTPLSRTFSRAELVQHMRALLRNELHADITLIAGSKRLAAHRAILSARSAALAAQLLVDPAQASLPLPAETRPETAELVLEYIYTGELPVLEAPQAIEVHALGAPCRSSATQQPLTRASPPASHFALERLRVHCAASVEKGASVQNAVALLRAARRLKQTDVERLLLSFIAGDPQRCAAPRDMASTADDPAPFLFAVIAMLQ